MFDYKSLRIVGNRISYQGVVVGTINDMDMSRQRFEFEDFLKDVESGKFHEGDDNESE